VFLQPTCERLLGATQRRHGKQATGPLKKTTTVHHGNL